MPVFAAASVVPLLTVVVDVVSRRSAFTVLSLVPMRALALPSAKQHPSGLWSQSITQLPKVCKSLLGVQKFARCASGYRATAA